MLPDASVTYVPDRAEPGTYNMSSFLPRSRAFSTAGLCTLVLFAIAAWLPNDAVDFVAWLIAIFVGLPVCIFAKVHVDRSAAPIGWLTPATLTFALRVFGALSLLLGLGILGWQAYNSFIRLLPEFTGLTAIAQACLPVALIGLGYRLLSQPLHAGTTDH